ncbi:MULTISPECIES: hypothetical protein [Marinobacter]|jgi:hypothetical protein|uniref:Uncharacterized protein n=1 Tax=Marinobacter excellens LAMA 842 TaxID=1306954 RepID=A0A137SBV6_9GAMM|nr:MULTISPECIES: hypothetical protein [Marinobacter]KXO09919.1 hypothetical protein J122_1866 [Marinobacter excellens LAMA 842]MCD1631293.1 hypothetical protein [Marinobacter shengliensis]
MKNSPLKCDFPETDLEQQLEKKLYRTHGTRLASPPALKVAGVSDSSEGMEVGVAYISERFMDIRTAFLTFRRGQLVVINLFMIIVLALGWVVSLFYSKALLGVLIAFGPVWAVIYLFETFFPLTLPVRMDRQEGFVYVGHRGTFYRIPWDELEVTFSYNWQYLGSGVVWERQYYAQLFMREKHYFCGKPPKMPLQRKRVYSGFKEEDMYRRWNFIVRYYNDGIFDGDADNLVMANYDTYRNYISSKSIGRRIFSYFVLIIFMPTMFWWKYTPFKYKWPKEVEEVFGKANNY